MRLHTHTLGFKLCACAGKFYLYFRLYKVVAVVCGNVCGARGYFGFKTLYFRVGFGAFYFHLRLCAGAFRVHFGAYPCKFCFDLFFDYIRIIVLRLRLLRYVCVRSHFCYLRFGFYFLYFGLNLGFNAFCFKLSARSGKLGFDFGFYKFRAVALFRGLRRHSFCFQPRNFRLRLYAFYFGLSLRFGAFRLHFRPCTRKLGFYLRPDNFVVVDRRRGNGCVCLL